MTHPFPLTVEQKARLEKLGEVQYYDTEPSSPDEWLERARGAVLVCSSRSGLLEKWQELENVLIAIPLVSIAWFDPEIGKKRNIRVVNAPGCNREAVAEWIIGMIINLMRELPAAIDKPRRGEFQYPKQTKGLAGKSFVILGKGNIGSAVGRMAEALLMKVCYFTRGDDLFESVKNVDVVVNALGINEQTINLLDDRFFNSLKRGSYYVAVTGDKIHDLNSILATLNDGTLAGAALDLGISPGQSISPTVQKLASHPKVLITPGIAYNSDVAGQVCLDIMIENLEKYFNQS